MLPGHSSRFSSENDSGSQLEKTVTPAHTQKFLHSRVQAAIVAHDNKTDQDTWLFDHHISQIESALAPLADIRLIGVLLTAAQRTCLRFWILIDSRDTSFSIQRERLHPETTTLTKVKRLAGKILDRGNSFAIVYVP